MCTCIYIIHVCILYCTHVYIYICVLCISMIYIIHILSSHVLVAAKLIFKPAIVNGAAMKMAVQDLCSVLALSSSGVFSGVR